MLMMLACPTVQRCCADTWAADAHDASLSHAAGPTNELLMLMMLACPTLLWPVQPRWAHNANNARCWVYTLAADAHAASLSNLLGYTSLSDAAVPTHELLMLMMLACPTLLC